MGVAGSAESVIAALDGAPVGFALVDRELRLVHANARLAEWVGGDAAGRLMREIPALAEVPAQVAERALAGTPILDEHVSGRTGRPILLNAFPVLSDDGAPTGVIMTLRDMSDWSLERAHLEQLATIASRLAAAATPEEVAEITADAGIEAIGASAAAVLLVRRSGTPLEIASARGSSAETLDEWQRIDRDTEVPVAQVVRDRAPVFMRRDDAVRDHPAVGTPSDRHHAWAALPLESHDEVRGALALSFTDAGSIEPSERPAMLALAALCGQALERASLARDIALANDRLRLLADASDVLSETLDYERTLQQLAELAVQRLADWCTVTIVEGGEIVDVAVAHADPEQVALVRRLQQEYPQDPDAPNGAPAVIRSGRTEYIPEIPDELLVAVSPDERILGILRDLGLRSVITAPLIARGRTLGALSLVLAESGAMYQPADVELAEDLANRAALAIDNARLYRERSQIADTLQASLLPPVLPDVPGFDVAARYRPGGDGVTVGGDFYDVFPTGDGRWLVAIGDVCGKGAPAATLTGVARHTARAAAMDDPEPVHVLASVNAALLRTDTANDLRFCTAAVGLLEAGSPSRIAVARAGHPPPLLRRADGTIEELGINGTLLGVYEDPELGSQKVAIGPGDLLLFYTDGVTESWWNAGGEQRLADTLRTLGSDVSAADAAAQVERMALAGAGSTSDDLAILVLRAL
jgi:serine phosphatase RsbU (regulator of sigma subunit)